MSVTCCTTRSKPSARNWPKTESSHERAHNLQSSISNFQFSMIPDTPIDPRQALEASLTALLLGELPPDQAEFLERAIAQDPALANQYERLKQTIQLVRETEVTTAKASAAQYT